MSEHPPPQEARWPEDVIFTLGHSTLPIEAFLALLQAYGIASGLSTSVRSRGRAIIRNSTTPPWPAA